MYKILHVTLEYIYGVGGITTVVNGLVQALQLKNIDNFVVTPFYDFYTVKYSNNTIKPITTVKHVYNTTIHTSIIFAATNNDNIVHYLVQPDTNSSVKKIFDVGEPLYIYQAFRHSEPQSRIEYFNSAIVGLINNPNLPHFDIIHNNAWHTSLSACLIKELKITPIPKIISTVHMLSEEQGIIIKKTALINSLKSIGLPLEAKFLDPNNNLNQMYLGLQYSDQVVMVSQGLIKDAISNKSFGLEPIFNTLMQEQRLHAITNGNNITNWDATLTTNLGEYALTHPIINSKIKIKQYLATKYNELLNKHNNPWYLYVGRFSEEKGIDMLPYALEEINKQNGCLILMGIYASKTVCHLITDLKAQNNVVIIDNMPEQVIIGKHFRAACEFTLIPSHKEGCGLVPTEAMVSSSIPIASDVQGLPDTIISLINNTETGNGFIYEDHPTNNFKNLKNIINIAYSNYLAWTQQGIINNLLSRIQQQAYQYDWNQTASDNYIKLYKHTIEQPPARSPLIDYKQQIINILHMALEFKEATLGGLGSVTTQMLEAQNKFTVPNSTKNIFNASIITPYYPMFDGLSIIHVLDVKHLYNNQEIVSSIYLNQENKHYLIKSCIPDLFNITTTTHIYANHTHSRFIDRIKYFSSAVAAFVNYNLTCNYHPNPQLLQMHGWHTILAAKLLTDYYKNTNIKTIFTVHINNTDRGTYNGTALAGIGLEFTNQKYILKQLGVNYCDYIITVSPNLLAECCEISHKDCLEIMFLKKAFIKAKLTCKITSIINGINYPKYQHLENIKLPLENYEPNLTIRKQIIKSHLAKELSKHSKWEINPRLPVILYIGRFSPEKGIDAFEKLLPVIKDKAVFYALGKGIHDDILKMLEDNNIQNNIFITNDATEQENYGAFMRACADFIFVPSHIEACGMCPIEGFANGSLCITTGAGGLKNIVTSFSFDLNQNTFTGNSFIYQDYNIDSLHEVINSALNLWENLTDQQKHQVHSQIIQEGKIFDWLNPQGSMHHYLNSYNHLILFKDKNPPETKTPSLPRLKTINKLL